MLKIQTSCRNESTNVFCKNFKSLFQSAQVSSLLNIVLTRLRFVLSSISSPVCFIYDLSLPRPCHLNVSWMKFSEPAFRHIFLFPHIVLSLPFILDLMLFFSYLIASLYILLLAQSGCSKFLLKWIILNSGLVEEEDRVNGRRG